MYEDFTLLVDGKNAFPEILKRIEKAKSSVLVNMFIWRDDKIGNELAKTVLAAAKRGVQVRISVDKYGVVCEKAEEEKKSFFHKEQTLGERIKIKTLEKLYPMAGAPKKAKDEYSPLYNELIAHPNIRIEKDVFKADHSKYYIIDGKTLILGGINVEDKENGADMQGRVYQDYMALLDGREYVEAFLEKLNSGADKGKDYSFGINRKKLKLFEMQEKYLSIINSATERLYIAMAYFSPLKPFVNALLSAAERGVKVTVVLPKNANFQDDSNKKTAKKLLKKSGGKIEVFFIDKMAHTKLVMNEKIISFGSTNITKKAFGQLDELNLFIDNGPSAFRDALYESIVENSAYFTRVEEHKKIKYNRLLAFLEGFLV